MNELAWIVVIAVTLVCSGTMCYLFYRTGYQRGWVAAERHAEFMAKWMPKIGEKGEIYISGSFTQPATGKSKKRRGRDEP